LMEEGIVNGPEAVDAFLEAVHDIPLDDIQPDPEVTYFILSQPHLLELFFISTLL